MKRNISVLIVDDNALLRLGLKDAISGTDDMELAGEAINAFQAVEKYREQQPDVVTLDYRMPECNGVECAKSILAEFPNARIIILSVYEGDEIIWNAVQAGAKGYIPKSGDIETFLESIREVANGGSYFPASIAKKLAARSEQDELTEREFDVLRLLVSGHSNKEMADALNLAEQTVKMHVSKIIKKLGVADRTQAALLAVHRGIVDVKDPP
ncbi:response regulator transcription factor [Pontiella agarivorans]|uniref:Response regulator transcription factor n=1 Tax=Pontiella agarivorans TaxID=3038953 RepID=A0ABU5MY48_9BACT|nr:response regulator transcription factor [Pontiella agarivorans]MDZ8119136.1 response regulator transcription factor [Pontiella agarivorans]